MKYVVLLRGINVGGKNKVPMANLRKCLESLGYENVTTYIASGNVIVESDKKPTEIQAEIERVLPNEFSLDSKIVRVSVLTHAQIKSIIEDKPAGFGDKPNMYHSDVIYLMDITEREAMRVFKPREGVDKIWSGNGVIYSQRLSAERVRSRLNKIIGTREYQSMTIRNWNTTLKLLELSK